MSWHGPQSVALSGSLPSVRDDILDRGLLRSEQPFIQKPFSAEQLVKEVGRMIPGS
jgi:hypothetical protein